MSILKKFVECVSCNYSESCGERADGCFPQSELPERMRNDTPNMPFRWRESPDADTPCEHWTGTTCTQAYIPCNTCQHNDNPPDLVQEHYLSMDPGHQKEDFDDVFCECGEWDGEFEEPIQCDLCGHYGTGRGMCPRCGYDLDNLASTSKSDNYHGLVRWNWVDNRTPAQKQEARDQAREDLIESGEREESEDIEMW